MRLNAPLSAALVLIALTASTPVAAVEGQSRDNTIEVIALKDARLKFEVNATDGDGGVQAFIDADQWSRMTIFDPDGRQILVAVVSGSMGLQGGTELFMESAEPSFDELSLEELLARFPEGTYEFRGRGLAGERLEGAAVLTHNIPDGPQLIAPLEGDGPRDPSNTVLELKTVGPANGSPIIGYQVLAVQTDTGLSALPKVALDVTMPPSATSLTIPDGFLLPNTEYEWEVLAIEQSGNQTLSSSFFTTSE